MTHAEATDLAAGFRACAHQCRQHRQPVKAAEADRLARRYASMARDVPPTLDLRAAARATDA